MRMTMMMTMGILNVDLIGWIGEGGENYEVEVYMGIRGKFLLPKKIK